MTYSQKTDAILCGLDFMDHSPQNLLDCFYVAESHARILAAKIDAIVELTENWAEAEWITNILEDLR